MVDNYDDAQDVADDLSAAGIGSDSIHILRGGEETMAPEDRGGMWDRVMEFFGAETPEEDVDYYAEGVRRKGVVVAADVPDHLVDQATRIMNSHGAVDIDERVAEWRKSGWTGRGRAAGEKAIPVAEEEVKIGKRQVARGGVRVYSRVIETPVEEDVRLREESATVERRRVDRPASEDAFKETSIEVEETAEEPVVSKQARVKEEVIVGKEASERTQRVRETARRTDVRVEREGARTTAYDADFRKHFQSSYSAGGDTYDTYSPAYEYGAALSQDKRYHGRSWAEVEEDVQRDWNRRYPGTWERFKDAIRHGWNRATA
jgi:uncharacterized protein (TIGR02271 family)